MTHPTFCSCHHNRSAHQASSGCALCKCPRFEYQPPADSQLPPKLNWLEAELLNWFNREIRPYTEVN